MVNKDLIIKGYKQGKSISAIALEAGSGRTYVYKVLREAGLMEQTESDPPSVKLGNLMKLKNLLLVFKDRYASKETKPAADKMLGVVDRQIREIQQK